MINLTGLIFKNYYLINSFTLFKISKYIMDLIKIIYIQTKDISQYNS